MHWVPLHDEEDLPPGLAPHAPEESEDNGTRERRRGSAQARTARSAPPDAPNSPPPPPGDGGTSCADGSDTAAVPSVGRGSDSGRRQKRRERRVHVGGQVQFDGSFRDWFEGRGKRGGERNCVMNMVDDATGTTLLHFVRGLPEPPELPTAA